MTFRHIISFVTSVTAPDMQVTLPPIVKTSKE